jgi:hypothetical protein
MTAHLHPEVAQILALANADAEVDRLDKAIVALDSGLAAAEKRSLDAAAAVAGAISAIEAHKTEARRRERELDTYAERRQGALRALETGAGDAAHAERQLAQVAVIVDRLETEALEGMERLDQLQNELAAAKKGAVDAEAAVVRARAETPPARAARVTEREAASLVRADAEAALPIEIRSRYALVRKKLRVAVAEVKDSTCTACHLSLPMQQLADLRAGRSAEPCRGCTRWLIVR